MRESDRQRRRDLKAEREEGVTRARPNRVVQPGRTGNTWPLITRLAVSFARPSMLESHKGRRPRPFIASGGGVAERPNWGRIENRPEFVWIAFASASFRSEVAAGGGSSFGSG